jgi:hypothetical protein
LLFEAQSIVCAGLGFAWVCDVAVPLIPIIEG